MNEAKLRRVIRKMLNEAGARQKDLARNWKQGDRLDLYRDDDEFGDEYIPDEIKAQMSAAEREEYADEIEDPYETMERSQGISLEDLVDSNVVPSVKGAAGMHRWIEANVMEPLRVVVVDPDTFEKISEFRESGYVTNAYQQAIDLALPVYKEVAAEVLGTDKIDTLPELNDDEFIGPNGMLEEIFWYDAFLKPYIRQVKKDKSPAEAFKSIKDRWKYMNPQNKASGFIRNVITPMFEYLLRDPV